MLVGEKGTREIPEAFRLEKKQTEDHAADRAPPAVTFGKRHKIAHLEPTGPKSQLKKRNEEKKRTVQCPTGGSRRAHQKQNVIVLRPKLLVLLLPMYFYLHPLTVPLRVMSGHADTVEHRPQSTPSQPSSQSQ